MKDLQWRLLPKIMGHSSRRLYPFSCTRNIHVCDCACISWYPFGSILHIYDDFNGAHESARVLRLCGGFGARFLGVVAIVTLSSVSRLSDLRLLNNSHIHLFSLSVCIFNTKANCTPSRRVRILALRDTCFGELMS